MIHEGGDVRKSGPMFESEVKDTTTQVELRKRAGQQDENPFHFESNT